MIGRAAVVVATLIALASCSDDRSGERGLPAGGTTADDESDQGAPSTVGEPLPPGAIFSPSEIRPGDRFTVSYPASMSVGPDLVVYRGGEPIYVLGADPTGGEPTIAPVEGGRVGVRPTLLPVAPSGRVEAVLVLPEDAIAGDQLCIEPDLPCDELPLVEP